MSHPRATAALVLLLASLVSMLAAYIGTHPVLPPCPTEDSVSCYWDADTMGNGHGRSYTTDEHGTPTYTN